MDFYPEVVYLFSRYNASTSCSVEPRVSLEPEQLRRWFRAHLKLINCTFTWKNKPEIDFQREVPPFLRPCHIYKQLQRLGVSL